MWPRRRLYQQANYAFAVSADGVEAAEVAWRLFFFFFFLWILLPLESSSNNIQHAWHSSSTLFVGLPARRSELFRLTK